MPIPVVSRNYGHRSLHHKSNGAQRSALGLDRVRAPKAKQGEISVTPWLLAYMRHGSSEIVIRSQVPDSVRLILDLETCVLAACAQLRISRLAAAWAIAPDGRIMRLPGFSRLTLSQEKAQPGFLVDEFPQHCTVVNGDRTSWEVDLESPIRYWEDELPPESETPATRFYTMSVVQLCCICEYLSRSGDALVAGWCRYSNSKVKLSRFLGSLFLDHQAEDLLAESLSLLRFSEATVQTLRAFCQWRSWENDERIVGWSRHIKQDAHSLLCFLQGAYGEVFEG